MPEETGGDFFSHIQQVTPAARRKVQGAEDLARGLEALESEDSPQVIRAAVEHAAAGLGR
eukprot:6740583-Pyramimonas_sp.AAC.1